MPKSLKRAAAVVSVLLLAMMVPVLNQLAGPVLMVPGGLIARAMIGQSEGASLYRGLVFFFLMVAIDVAAYYLVFSTIERMSSRQEDDEILK